MWSSKICAVLCAAFLLAVAACGFQPLYKKDAVNGVVTDDFARINVATVKTKKRVHDRLGQKFHNLLLDRLNPGGRPRQAAYVLSVTMAVSKEETGVQITDDATRARLSVSATFSLRDVATNQQVLFGAERSVNSYNIVDSEFATLSAEADASDRAIRELSDALKIRIGVYFARQRQKETAREDRRR